MTREELSAALKNLTEDFKSDNTFATVKKGIEKLYGETGLEIFAMGMAAGWISRGKQ